MVSVVCDFFWGGKGVPQQIKVDLNFGGRGGGGYYSSIRLAFAVGHRQKTLYAKLKELIKQVLPKINSTMIVNKAL